MSCKAKKVSPNEASGPLTLLVKLLNINKPPLIYRCQDKIYIDATEILDLLDVDEKWFKSNSKSLSHYILINNKVFVNKYGFTKILGQSNESIAMKLQDYIYDVIYKLEETGHVNKEDMLARQKLLHEINFYQNIQAGQAELAESLKQELQTLQNDYTILSDENAVIKEKYDVIQKENDALLDLAKKLITSIRTYNEKLLTKGIAAAASRIPDLDYIINDESYIMDKVYMSKAKPKHDISNKVNVYILRMLNSKYAPCYYWSGLMDISQITDMKLETYITESQQYELNDSKSQAIEDIGYLYKRTVSLPHNKAILLSSMIEHMHATESQVIDIIELLLKC